MKNKEPMPFIEQLLNVENVEWKKIGEVCEIYNGLNGKNKNHFENIAVR